MSEHVVPKKIYYAIFATLLVLTGVTIAVAFVDLGPFNNVVAMAIAVFKATLVVLYFMHVRYSSRLTWIVVCAGFFWFGLMIALTFADYLSRGWLAGPR
ncbi:MAG TPA: cytochrome C oxidase subunit IV family protein [Blastocatellia bacterium]|nr:cytochrome C oxidase subunit IV family protein [Blastocatellia bacterium]